jgi:hypothetical protein
MSTVLHAAAKGKIGSGIELNGGHHQHRGHEREHDGDARQAQTFPELKAEEHVAHCKVAEAGIGMPSKTAFNKLWCGVEGAKRIAPAASGVKLMNRPKLKGRDPGIAQNKS